MYQNFTMWSIDSCLILLSICGLVTIANSLYGLCPQGVMVAVWSKQIQGNSALWPPRYYGHVIFKASLFCPDKLPIHFPIRKPVNSTTPIIWGCQVKQCTIIYILHISLWSLLSSLGCHCYSYLVQYIQLSRTQN